MKENMENLKTELQEKMNKINTLNELNELKVEYLGKKGKITELSSIMKDLSIEEKKEFGSQLNEIKNFTNNLFDSKKQKIETSILNEKLKSEKIDISLPSTKIKTGSKHPMSRIQEQFEDLFSSMGYTIYEGPELESDENCFQKLNIAKGHPARDAQDTFYLENEYESFLLRSQTSTAQVRAMEENQEKGPLKIVCPGKVYRRD